MAGSEICVLGDKQDQSGTLGHLSVSEAAKHFETTPKTIIRWCKKGLLPCQEVRYGTKTTFNIFLQSHDLTEWIIHLETGLFNGKPFSPRTVAEYLRYIRQHLCRYGDFTLASITKELLRIPVERYATKDKYYKACLCYGKFIQIPFLNELKRLKPIRHLPPKRKTITETKLYEVLKTMNSKQNKVMLLLLVHTGIRAGELCGIRKKDLDLDLGILQVLGKGNKLRRVGLSSIVLNALREQAQSHQQEFLFINREGNPMTRHGLYKRLSSYHINPHALRRAFVTINANKGRPLQMLQIACGHSDIKTTMAYCRTSEQEVIDAMKGWD